MEQSDNGFVISSMADTNPKRECVVSAMDVDKILQLNLKLSNYSDKINTIILNFMAIDPESGQFRPDKKNWRWKSQDFAMYANVPDYKKFCESNKTEARKIIAELYIKSIETYLSKRKDIDYVRLYADVKEPFVKGGVL